MAQSIKAYSAFQYCTTNGDSNSVLTEEQWVVIRGVKAVKGQDFKGFCYINNRKYLSAEKDLLAQVFVSSAAKKLSAYIGRPSIIVPVPNKSMTVHNRDQGRVIWLAQQLSNQLGVNSLGVFPHIRWAKEIDKANQGGTRNSLYLEANLEIVSELPNTAPIILFDDVITTGAHIGAITRKLKNNHYDVSTAFSIFNTTLDINDYPYQISERDIAY